jgi:hypothetical protein
MVLGIGIFLLSPRPLEFTVPSWGISGLSEATFHELLSLTLPAKDPINRPGSSGAKENKIGQKEHEERGQSFWWAPEKQAWANITQTVCPGEG